MGPLGIVAREPVGGHFADASQRVEGVRSEDLGAIGAIEALEIHVLLCLARLDVVHGDVLLGAPARERDRGEFGTIVDLEDPRRAMQRDQILEHTDHAEARQRHPDFDGESLAVALVQHVQRAEVPPVVERVGHEVERPGVIELRRCVERVLHAPRDPAPCAPRQVQPERAGDAMHSLVIPGVAQEPQAIKALPEAPARPRGTAGR